MLGARASDSIPQDRRVCANLHAADEMAPTDPTYSKYIASQAT